MFIYKHTNMEFIKAFESNNSTMHITIRGTHENPLFRASDIGEILEITQINSTIRDFDETEKQGLHIVDVIGRNQEVTFLTEKGLYEILFRSRKPIAKQFKSWVYEVIRELRLNGVFKLKNEYKKALEALEEKDQHLLMKDQEISYALILNFKNKHVIYLILVGENIVKFGYTKDIEKRFKEHKSEFGKDIILKIVYETVYNREFEIMIKEDDIIKQHIIEKVYKKNQTELIQLSDEFDYNTLVKRIELIKNKVNGDLITNLINENKQLKNEIEILNQQLESGTGIKVKHMKLLADEGTFPIIAFHYETKTEHKLETLTKAKKFLDVDQVTIINYINNRKQLNGYVLRSDNNNPYWILPDNFKSSGVVKQTTQNIFIKRIDKATNEVTYFNSITEASLYLQQELDGQEIKSETDDSIKLKKALGELLRNLPTRKTILNKYRWFKMKNIGLIVNLDGTRTCIDEEYPKDFKESENIEESKQEPIIVRNLDTNEEKIYPEGYSLKIYKTYGLRKETLEKFLNEPHNYKNYTFRNIGKPYWNPPETYMRNQLLDNARVNYYLKVTNNKTNITTYHHSATDMALSLFPNLDKVNTAHDIIRKLNNKRNPSILHDYTIIKVEKCGELVYPDGTIENIEKILA